MQEQFSVSASLHKKVPTFLRVGKFEEMLAKKNGYRQKARLGMMVEVAQFLNLSGHVVTIPLVRACFAPAGKPFLAGIPCLMGAQAPGASRNTGLIALAECAS